LVLMGRLRLPPMVWVTGPFLITSAVLVVGGMLKLRDSRPSRAALSALGIPAPRLLAHLAGPVEIAVGASALLLGGWGPAVLVTALYLSFVAMIAVQLQRDDVPSCGCFGRLSARPSPIHLVANAALALVGAVAVLADPPGLMALAEQAETTAEVILGVALIGLATRLLVAVLTVLPATSEAARPDLARQFEITGTRR
jgi:uncharacterized membrane protein YphA (DoxX/SURF4 family)